MIEKISREGIGYSTVDLSDVRHVFAAAVPRRGTTLRQQADDALGVIEAATRRQGVDGAIVHQAVFLADIGQMDECRGIIREFYGADLPATTYIPQPPCDGKLLAIECLGVGPQRGEVQIERIGEQLVVVRHNGIAWAHCAPSIPSPQDGDVYDGVLSGFERIRSLLGGADMRFEQVIRVWFYCGSIGGQDGAASRYQELNRARRDFYQNVSFACYPASTGIGAQGRSVAVSAIAFATQREDIVAVPLENPHQTSAYAYSSGSSSVSPLFSRALALSCGDYATIFISGTASITGEETRHTGDAVAQTHETLDNIAALISEENLAGHGLPGLGASPECLGMVRVYLKRPEDYAAVRVVCERRLGELPTIYATADVCRPELLVEIEGVAFSRNAGR